MAGSRDMWDKHDGAPLLVCSGEKLVVHPLLSQRREVFNCASYGNYSHLQTLPNFDAAGCGFRECTGDIVTLETTSQPSQTGVATFEHWLTHRVRCSDEDGALCSLPRTARL